MSDKLKMAVDRIAKKRELPDDMKQSANYKIFRNSLIADIYMIVLIIINILYLNTDASIFVNSTKIISMLVIIAVIVFFELAYKHEDKTFAINGIETLVYDVFIMFIPYVYFLISDDARAVFMFLPVIFAIYYIIKSIGSYVYLHKAYLNSLSDVKEILKEEEKSYLEEDSKKIIKEKKEKKKKSNKKGGK